MIYLKEKRLASLVCLPALAVCVVLFYLDFLYGRFYIWEDLLRWYYPSANYFCTSVASGRFPLWLPSLFDGVPYYTDIESSVFYPPLWVIVPFARGGTLPWLAYQWYIVFHILLGAVFMCLYLRSLRLNSWSCLVGTIIFCFSGFASLHIIHFPMLQVYAWLPLQLLLVDKAVETGRAKFYALLTVAILLSFLAGFPQTTLYDSLLVVGYWLFVRYRRSAGVGDGEETSPLRQFGREVLKMAGVYVSVLLLAAFMVLPTLEHWHLSVRNVIRFDAMAVQSMPWQNLIHLAVPKFFGCFNDAQVGERFWGADRTQADVVSGEVNGYWQYWEFAAYAGQISLLAVAVFLFHRRETRGTRVRFFLAAAGLALWFMLGRHGGLYTLLYYVLPGISMFRSPSRMSCVLDFSAAVLAAYLIEFVRTGQTPRLGRALLTVLAVGTVGIIGFFSFGRMILPALQVGTRAAFSSKQIWVSAAFLLGLANCLCAIQFPKAPWVRQITCGAMVLLTFCDLYYAHSLFHMGVRDPDRYYTDHSAVTQSYHQAVRDFGLMRFTQMQSGRYSEVLMDANMPLLEPGLETHRGYLNFQPRLVNTLAGITNVNTRLDIQNVAFAAHVSPNSQYLKWEIRTNALPRLTFYTNVRRYKTQRDILHDLQIGNIDYHTTAAVLDSELGSDLPVAASTTDITPFRVTIRTASPEYYTVDYAIKQPGLLMVDETFFPGWEVVDQEGRAYKMIHSFLAFKGVVIPKAGEGQLTFRFRPRSFRLGGAISAATLVLVGLIYTRLIYRERCRSSLPAVSLPQEQTIPEPQSV